jgi:ABC-2 type transport system ATP-binding protein
MLKVENVTKYYDKLKALDNLTFEVNKGDVFGLLGVNGAGKTTTFRLIMNLIDANSGKITLDGKEIDYSVTDKIGFLTEERSLLTKMTIMEQAHFYGTLKGMKKNEIKKKLDAYLKKFYKNEKDFNLDEFKKKKIKELSKGNQQKIQFIMAVINSPKLLILDEPFSGLDPFNIELFKQEILELKEKGSMIIFSSHRMEHVELFCNKILVLAKGKTLLHGYLDDIKNEYKRKNVTINGDIDINEIKKIKGVISAEKIGLDYEVKIEDEGINDALFNTVKKHKINKYILNTPSLHEIFIEKVGEYYEG